MVPGDFFSNPAAMAFLAANLSMSFGLSWLLAGKTYRKEAAAIVVVGFVAALLKMALVQRAPQWLYVNSDSLRYMQHSSALALHWAGSAVDPIEHALNGLLAMGRQHPALWLPSDQFSYSSVLGSHEWLYAAYLACWRTLTQEWAAWTLLSQAALCAFFPAAACGIARSLGAKNRAAYLAAFVCLVDPSAAVNASWLLKDTLACFIVSIAVWSAVRALSTRDPWLSATLLALSLPLLGAVRFAALVALIIGAALLLAACFIRGWAVPVRRLALPLAAGLVLFPFLYAAPQMPRNFANTLFSPLRGEAHVLSQSDRIARGIASPEKHGVAVDEAVLNWRTALHDRPVEAVVTSVAHTLFAPYPWVPFTVGLDYKTGIELYYPGVVLWMLCLPFVIFGVLHSFRQSTPQFIFVMGMLCALLCAYTAFLGEWSTRQRVFMLPVFFAVAAIGFDEFMRVLAVRRTSPRSPLIIEK